MAGPAGPPLAREERGGLEPCDEAWGAAADCGE